MAVTVPDIQAQLRERLDSGKLHRSTPYWSWTFTAMGTRNEIILHVENERRGEECVRDLGAWLMDFEARYSRFIDSSLIQRINLQAGTGAWTALEPRDVSLFSLCDWFHWRTHGVFDPTSGSLLKHWDYHHENPRLPTDEEIKDVQSRTGWKRVERTDDAIRLPVQGMRLDLGGIGKEYAADQVAQQVENYGIKNYLINFGRDIRCGGVDPTGSSWRLGLEHPTLENHCWGGVGLQEGAIASSGNYRRALNIAGKQFGHLLDVRTGRPAQTEVLASWAIAPTCTEAGILASCAFIMGLSEGLELLEVSPHTAGCLWTARLIHQTRRFNRYVLEES